MCSVLTHIWNSFIVTDLISVCGSQVGGKSKAAWRMEDYMSAEAIDKKVAELVSSRGRKGTDAKVVLRQLELLCKAAKVRPRSLPLR